MRTDTRSLPPWTGALLRWLLFLALGGLFVWKAVDLVPENYRNVRDEYSITTPPFIPNNDFSMFYAGSRLITSSERAHTYEKERQVREILEVRALDPAEVPPGETWVNWLRYYNPPLYLIAASPMTLLDVRTAYLVAAGVNIGLGVVLALAAGAVVGWRFPQWPLLALAIPAFEPVYFALFHGQPSILIAVLILAAFLTIERGRRVAGAVFLTLVGIKPQYLVLPAFSALKHNLRLVAPLVAAGIVLLLLPFAWVGLGGLQDYVSLTLGRGSEDLNDPVYSSALMNWAGFLRVWTGEPQPEAWLGLSAITVALFALTFVKADLRVSLAGALLTTLLVIPHGHPQDWVILIPVAALVLSRPSRSWVIFGNAAVLLALFFASNDWNEAHATMSRGEEAVYWAVPAAFVMLLWQAATAWLDPLPAPERAGRAPRLPSSTLRRPALETD